MFKHSLAAALALAAGSTAHAQWTVVSLHPAGATESEAKGISGAQQVGTVRFAAGPTHAALWSGAAPSVTYLDPTVSGGGTALAALNGVQGGETTINPGTTASQTHAVIWNGTPGSVTDLHPDGAVHSGVYALADGTQGGYFFTGGSATFGTSSPCLWHGSAETFVDLTPAGFFTGAVLGAAGNQQVGATYDTGLGWACVWNGTAESFVNLNPDPQLFSAATCTDGVNQYGTCAIITELFAGLYPVQWSGTPESMVNLLVDDPATRWGEVHATHAGWQVGYTTDNDGASNPRACYWTGLPGTFANLHQHLPAGYSGSNALGVWRHAASGTTYIVGWAENAATTRREAVMWVNGPGVNLITSVAPPAGCAAGPGDNLPFTVRVLNAGFSASGPVALTVTLPPSSVATFTSSTPAPTAVTGSQLTFTLPAVAAGGGSADVTVNLAAVGGGDTAAITAAAATPGESDPTNNTATGSSRIEPAPAATAPARALLSTNPAFSNSLVPGGGNRFTALNRAAASPSGNWLSVQATTNHAAAQNTVLLRIPSGGPAAIIAQKGVTTLPHGAIEAISAGHEVNDSGTVAFSGNDNGATTADAFIATSDGTTISEVAREGGAIPAIPGVNYADVENWPNLTSGGFVAFACSSSPAGSSAYIRDSGLGVVARQGVTTPSGAPAPVSNIVRNSTGVWGLAMDDSGGHSIYQADLATGSNTNDQAIIADGALVMQEGVTVLPGCTSPVGPGNIGPGNKFIAMGPAGQWFVRGSSIDAAEDWIAQGVGSTITRVTKNGDPIALGSSELFREDPALGTAFFAMAGDAGNHALIGGTTNNPDEFADTVLVVDNFFLAARENDPVDVDGNGVFDDGLYIRSFETDSVSLTPQGVLAIVTLRDADAAHCRTDNTSRGQALVLIPVSYCGPSDFNGDGDVGTDQDIEAFFACLGGNCCPNCFPGGADFNGDGDIGTDQDIEAFFRVLGGGHC